MDSLDSNNLLDVMGIMLDEDDLERVKKRNERYADDIDPAARAIRLDIISMVEVELRQFMREVSLIDLATLLSYLNCTQVDSIVYGYLSEHDSHSIRDDFRKIRNAGLPKSELVMSLRGICKVMLNIDRSAIPSEKIH